MDIGTDEPGVVSTYASSFSGVSLAAMLRLKGPDENTAKTSNELILLEISYTLTKVNCISEK